MLSLKVYASKHTGESVGVFHRDFWFSPIFPIVYAVLFKFACNSDFLVFSF